jgi:hypothetical protein
MHRLFGKAKPKVEAPSLEDTSGGIGKRITDGMYMKSDLNFATNPLTYYALLYS